MKKYEKYKRGTGKSLSEALVLATNPQYDKRLFTELQVQYTKTTSSEHVVYTNCFWFLYWHSEQFMCTTCSEHLVFMYWTDGQTYSSNYNKDTAKMKPND